MKKLIYEIKSQSEKFGNLKTDELEKEIFTLKKRFEKEAFKQNSKGKNTFFMLGQYMHIMVNCFA
jgi:hypothetical protein